MQLVYKYAPACGIQYLLRKGTIKFASPKGQNDVFEGLFDRRFDANRTLAKAITNFRKENPVTSRWSDQNLLESDEFCANRLLFAAGMLSATREMLSEYGLACFTTDSTHPLLWSHYASKGTGISVGFETPALVKELDPFHSGFVSYGVPRPLLREHGGLQKLKLETLTRKSVHWSYEREFRLIRQLSVSGRDEIITFNQLIIKHVVIGPFTTLESIKDVLLWHRENTWVKLSWALPNIQDDRLDLHKIACSEEDLLQCAALRDEYI